MRDHKKRIVFIGVVLLVIVILTATPIILPRMILMKAVYLETEKGNNIFVDLEDGDSFTGTIPKQRVYDENGEKISEEDLNNGDVVNIYGDGGMADVVPRHYDMITKIERTEKSNQKYIEEYGHFLEEY